MIKIGVQTSGIRTDLNMDETYRIISEAGFDAADANIDDLFPDSDVRSKKLSAAFAGSDRDCLTYVKPWRDAALKYHIDNYQAHAPFPSILYGEEEFSDVMIEVLKKAIVCADYIGCRNLIVHPFHYSGDKRLMPEEEWEINIDRYTRLIPRAKEYGVTICLENMFTHYHGKTYAGCCGTPDEACACVDELNRIAGAPCFGFCLDTGHLILSGQEILRSMRRLGKRIRAFHVHDNDGVSDQHIAPYLGVMDWNRFSEGLADIEFDGTMCFETFRSCLNVDPGLRPIMLRYICQTGRIFAEKAEKMKA